ncbi:MAG: flagellar brake protein [gamma proteobacterium symbiont of Lucinoma myriamae]|nr:flagellar brake protein [gamma proteobacterium symbiont of Lucinoma myriamae]MCU7819460.1 flagellar brake protein [gamma proteobacterium symbiont of Lucinoma myriamae]MCU7833087.1 flagellar brake protein [gamma proteobacterium symbiont of Lucinoma myriamae]
MQRSILDTDEAIVRLLKQLQQHLVIITAKFPSDLETYNTSIIKIDYPNKLFYLDELIPETGNDQIKSLKKVHLRTRLDGAILTAECLLKETGKENGLVHYIMHFPTLIKSTQRRDSYRISIPLSKRYQVNMQTESGQFIAGFLNNISFSGLAIRLEHNQSFDLNIGEDIPFLTLHLHETITCEMEVKRISNTMGNTIISGHLVEISPAHQRSIQKFISRLDRQKRKQNKDQSI